MHNLVPIFSSESCDTDGTNLAHFYQKSPDQIFLFKNMQLINSTHDNNQQSPILVKIL